MNTRRLLLGRWSPSWLFGLLVSCAPLLFVGCQNDDITTYQAPKSEPLASTAIRFRQRLIAVAIPQGKQLWVVKLLGPEKQVEPFVEQFDQLMKTVELTKEAGKPITWKLPEGWSQLPDNGIEFRYATFRIATDDAIEVTVARVDNSPKLANINRWRNQIGLGPIPEEKIDLYAKPQTIKSAEEAWRVDMTGSLMTPTAKRSAPRFQNQAVKPPKYKTPDGWQPAPAEEFSVVNFVIQQGDDKAKVSLSPLNAQSGTLLQNVNRWRNKQLGLPEIDENQLQKEIKADKVGGADAQYVKIVGEKNTILGFIVKHGDHTWYLKMIGTKALVEKQEAVFVEFCRSLEF